MAGNSKLGGSKTPPPEEVKNNPNLVASPDGIAKYNGPDDPHEYGQWLAHQDQETQDYYLWENNEGNESDAAQREQIRRALMEERSEAFQRGEILTGVNEAGQGIDAEFLPQDAKARAIQAKAQAGVSGAVDLLPGSIDDYTLNPTLDEGAGYDLVDRMQDFGQAVPLDQQLQLDAIAQQRGDTTGVDAQKSALADAESAYDQGGLNALDRARIAQSTQMRQAQARGNQLAIRQNAEEQGRAGGRQQFLLEQQAQQSALGQRANDDLQMQALALGRQDKLLGMRSDMGGEIQTAQDTIDKFNTEDQRAMRDTGNEARSSTWQENNRRESANRDTHNSAEGVDFATKTARSSANTDRTNSAEAFNKSGAGGARGLFRERLAAKEAEAGHGEVGASLLNSQAQAEFDRDAAQEAAAINAAGNVVGTASDVITAGITKKKPGEV